VRGLVFGLRCGALLGTYNPDGSLLKTLEQSLFEGSPLYLTRLPRSGMMRNGRIYEQVTWVRRTEGNGSGLWRTPDANMGMRGPKSWEQYQECMKSGKHAINLNDQMKWPTPQQRDYRSGKRVKSNSAYYMLNEEVLKWPTPSSRDWKDGCNVKNVPENCLLGRAVEPTKMNGSLDPGFVEYLMGYPIGWTDLGHSEIVLSLRSRNCCSEG